MSSWVLHISRDGDPATSLGSLFQFSDTFNPFFQEQHLCNYMLFFVCSVAMNCRGLSVKSDSEARLEISLPVEAEGVVEHLQSGDVCFGLPLVFYASLTSRKTVRCYMVCAASEEQSMPKPKRQCKALM